MDDFKINTTYHVYTHANGLENIFRTKENYRFFLEKYAIYINPVATTYAYCLMPNHFHLLIETKSEKELKEFYEEKYFKKDKKPIYTNIAKIANQQLSNFLNSYSKSFNKVFKRKGKLFLQSIVNKEINADKYFLIALFYIHNNPVKHGFTKEIDDWKYSSYNTFLSDKDTKIDKNTVLKYFQNIKEFKNFHKRNVEDNLFDAIY